MKPISKVKVVSTPENRSWFLNYLRKLDQSLNSYREEIRSWKNIIREDARLQDDLGNVKDAEERAMIQRKLEHDASALVEDLQRNAAVLETSIKQGEEKEVDEFFKEFNKITKAMERLETQKELRLKDLFEIVRFRGNDQVDQLNRILRGKVLKYQGVKFHMEAYAYRFNIAYVTFAEIDHAVELRKETIISVLNAKAEALKKGLTKREDRTPEHVIDYIKHNSNVLDPATLLANVSGFRIVHENFAAHIDNLNIAQGLAHFRGYPADLWVPLDKTAMEDAVVITSFIPSLEAKLKNTYFGNVENVVKGIDSRKRPVSVDKFEQLTEFGLSEKEVKMLRKMRASLRLAPGTVIRPAKPAAVEEGKGAEVIPFPSRKEAPSKGEIEKRRAA